MWILYTKIRYLFLHSTDKYSLPSLVLYLELGEFFSYCQITDIFGVVAKVAGSLTEVFNIKIKWRQLPGELPNI